MARTLICPLVVLGSGLAAAACSPAMMQAHARVGEGEVAAAVGEAEGDRIALIEVAIRVLIGAMDDPDARERAAAGLRVGEDYARPFLRSLFEDSRDERARVLIAEVWAELGSGRMRRFLEERLTHDDPEIRVVATRSVARRSRSESFFRARLADGDRRVRTAAVAALGRKTRSSWAPELLAEAARGDPDWSVRAAALRALARLDQGDLLLEAARAELVRPDNPDTVKLAAIKALGRAEDLLAAEALLVEQLEGGSPSLRLAAAEILASSGQEPALEHLRSALTSPDPVIAQRAAAAAARVGEPLRGELVLALSHPEPEVRLEAAAGLARLGEDEPERERARAALIRLADGPGLLGLRAALTLGRAGDESGLTSLRLAAALSDESPRLRAQAAFFCGFYNWALGLAAAGMSDEAPAVRVAAATSVLRIIQRTGTRPSDG